MGLVQGTPVDILAARPLGGPGPPRLLLATLATCCCSWQRLGALGRPLPLKDTLLAALCHEKPIYEPKWGVHMNLVWGVHMNPLRGYILGFLMYAL